MAVRGEPRYGGRPDESACPQHQDAHASLPMTETLRPAAPSVRARHKRVRGPAVSWIGAPEKHATHPRCVFPDQHHRPSSRTVSARRFPFAQNGASPQPARGCQPSRAPVPGSILINRIRTIVAGWELTEPELGAHLEGRDYAWSDIAGRPERMTARILTHVSRPGLVILA